MMDDQIRRYVDNERKYRKFLTEILETLKELRDEIRDQDRRRDEGEEWKRGRPDDDQREVAG